MVSKDAYDGPLCFDGCSEVSASNGYSSNTAKKVNSVSFVWVLPGDAQRSTLLMHHWPK